MMSIYEEVAKRVSEILGTDYQVEAREFAKTNYGTKPAISVVKDGIGTIIYPDEIVAEYETGDKTLEDVAQYVVDVFTDTKDAKEGVATRSDAEKFAEVIRNKEWVLENVFHVIVNPERNKFLLETAPHKDFLDLAVIYKCQYKSGSGFMTSNVTDGMLEFFGITREELEEAATANAEKMGYCYQSMFQALLGTIGAMGFDAGEFDELPPIGDGMYVLSNKDKVFGASVMTYTKYLKSLAEFVRNDLYVLPSSIHEVIAIPAAEHIDTRDLLAMVREVNETEVSEADYLNDNVYVYRRATDTIEIAEIA